MIATVGLPRKVTVKAGPAHPSSSWEGAGTTRFANKGAGLKEYHQRWRDDQVQAYERTAHYHDSKGEGYMSNEFSAFDQLPIPLNGPTEPAFDAERVYYAAA